MIYRISCIGLLGLLIGLSVSAQNEPTLFSAADTFFIARNTEVHTYGNCVISGNSALLSHHGLIQTYSDQNPGNFELQNAGSVISDGNYKVQQDWINNGRLRIDSGLVEMYGDYQFFSGDSISSFYDLLLTGTDKKEQQQHIRVRNQLDLTQRELAVEDWFLYLDNPDAGAIVYDATFMAEGIISTDEDGVIKKVVHTGASNLIPTGSSENSFRHRPIKVELLPGSSSDTAHVTFHHHSPDLSGAPSSDKDTSLCKIQTAYFYTFNASDSTSNFDLDFASLPATDGVYPDIARWDNPTWKAIYDYSSTLDINYVYHKAYRQSDFVQEHYALAHRTPVAPVISAEETACYNHSPVQVITPLNQPWYEWSFPDNSGASVQDGQGSPSATISWGDVIGGTVMVSYQNAEGCWSFPDSIYIEDISIQADFQINSVDYEDFGSDYMITNLSDGANVFEWYVNDELLSPDNTTNFIHTFTTNGEETSFDVWLIAEQTESGCIDTAYHRITIPAMFVFYVPNSFTPDGDGINDFFFAQTSEIYDLEMLVFNRWGELIVSQKGGAEADTVTWDGTYQGSFVPTGTYVYVFIVSPTNPNVSPSLRFTGSVNVLR